MTAAPFLSRHLGDYLLVAQLSEDALGTVFRALYAPDERRFVRLRLLQAADLPAESVRAAIEENGGRTLLHEAVVRQPELGLVEGVPYHAWNEAAGWTLDALLARVRGLGIRIPPQYALLIAERIASALEHAHRTSIDGRPMHHGALWPGFVSLSNDSEIRVGGFGLASAILPSLGRPRLCAEVAPYVAPESRGRNEVGANSDVYSLGAILLELLTGRRPALESPLAELREEEVSSRELGAFLCMSLAPAAERFPSAIEMRRALQELLTGPYSLYTANLALFLYKLLNPESQSVAPSSDWESTNPVVVSGQADGAHREDGAAEPEVARVATTLILEQADDQEESAHDEPLFSVLEWRAVRRRAWSRIDALAAGIAAVGLATGLVLAVGGGPSEPRILNSVSLPAPALPPAAPAPVVSEVFPQAPPEPRGETTEPERPRSVTVTSNSRTLAASVTKPERASPRRRRLDDARERAAAESARFDAAFARIAADRVEAGELARKPYVDARGSEREGDRLLQGRDYAGADAAFRRAAGLYRRAESLSFDERVRRVKLTAGK
jgi:hypothetical protein